MNPIHNDHITLIAKTIMWFDPNWWIWTSLLLFVACLIHFFPMSIPEDNHKTIDHFMAMLRRFVVAGLSLLGIIFPCVLYLAFGSQSNLEPHQSSAAFQSWFIEMLGKYWSAPTCAVFTGVTGNFVWHRYVEPYVSGLKRKYRVNQHEDEQSDINKEMNKLAPKEYEPEKYFKDGWYFMGLDKFNQPIYISDAKFHELNMAIYGPTGTGKGVLAGILLKQAIRKGNATWLIDPKTDDNLAFIAQEGAKEAGRPFVYLDLNPGGKGSWHPFKGGELRSRRARVLEAFRLGATESDSGVYRSKERVLLDRAMNETDCSVKALYDYVLAETKDQELSQLRDSLAEWAQVSTFVPPKKKEGHSIKKSLLNNAVVYVRGHRTDPIVRQATITYLGELVQELMDIKKQRTSQVTIFADEISFIVSKEIGQSISTVRQFHCNMLLATQGVTDLKQVQAHDKSINGEAFANSFNLNCQLKMIYRAGDTDTIDMAVALGGKEQIRVGGREKTVVNRWGGEKWDNNRTFDLKEQEVVTDNKLLALGDKVGILYRPGAVATAAFTHWVTVDRSNPSWVKPEVEEAPVPAEAKP